MYEGTEICASTRAHDLAKTDIRLLQFLLSCHLGSICFFTMNILRSVGALERQRLPVSLFIQENAA